MGAPLGLTAAEAGRRLALVGPNELPASAPPSAWRRAVGHLREPMSMLLVVAAVVTGVLAHEPDQAIAIAAIVVLNASIGVVQEGRAAGALDALRALESPTATVRRDGHRVVVRAAALVPGDLVLLRAGDRVPADLRLASGSWLEVDESVLTGESVSVLRRGDEAGADVAWSGTSVTGGEGSGEVLATGPQTKFGQIAGALGGRRRSERAPARTRARRRRQRRCRGPR